MSELITPPNGIQLPRYSTAILCMDGGFTRPVQKNMKNRHDTGCVDMIPQPGIIKVLAENTNTPRLELIEEMIELSVVDHGSRAIAIAAHHRCLGNPVPKEKQLKQLPRARGTVERMLERIEKKIKRKIGKGELQKEFDFNVSDIETTLLWINEHRLPEEVHISGATIYSRELVFA